MIISFSSRDSEIAILMEDVEFVDSAMNGKPYRAGHLARDLRTRLLAEHLGLPHVRFFAFPWQSRDRFCPFSNP